MTRGWWTDGAKLAKVQDRGLDDAAQVGEVGHVSPERGQASASSSSWLVRSRQALSRQRLRRRRLLGRSRRGRRRGRRAWPSPWSSSSASGARPTATSRAWRKRRARPGSRCRLACGCARRPAGESQGCSQCKAQDRRGWRRAPTMHAHSSDSDVAMQAYARCAYDRPPCWCSLSLPFDHAEPSSLHRKSRNQNQDDLFSIRISSRRSEEVGARFPIPNITHPRRVRSALM